jgi:hypothetical protein
MLENAIPSASLPDRVVTELMDIADPVDRWDATRAVTHDERLIHLLDNVIIDLWHDGNSNRAIGKMLGIDPTRVAFVLNK